MSPTETERNQPSRPKGREELSKADKAMLGIKLFFDDLNFDAQSRLWQAVQWGLLARGDVEYRTEDESEDEFQQRLQEAIDDYINRHNQSTEFFL